MPRGAGLRGPLSAHSGVGPCRRRMWWAGGDRAWNSDFGVAERVTHDWSLIVVRRVLLLRPGLLPPWRAHRLRRAVLPTRRGLAGVAWADKCYLVVPTQGGAPGAHQLAVLKLTSACAEGDSGLSVARLAARSGRRVRGAAPLRRPSSDIALIPQRARACSAGAGPGGAPAARAAAAQSAAVCVGVAR